MTLHATWIEIQLDQKFKHNEWNSNSLDYDSIEEKINET
jgi:hypothetical protein